MPTARDRARPWLDLWVVVVVAVVCAPMLVHRGYGLARDMVFVPRTPVGPAQLGLGSSPARAVPLDAVIGVLTGVVDGELVFRVAVLGVLLLAGWGAHRRLRAVGGEGVGVPARALVALFSVWNPFVVERLALGQWALLASYAAFWWIPGAVRRCAEGDRRGWLGLVALLGLASLTPTGGVLAAGLVACEVWVLRGRKPWTALALAAVWQLPWVLPSVLSTAVTTSDPVGVRVFEARGDPVGGVWTAVLGTGGIWDRFVVPTSQDSPVALLLAVVVVLSVAACARTLWARERGLVVASGVGLVLAVLAHLPGGAPLLSWAVAHVPGAGLLRDGQKWVLPFAVLAVLAVGLAAVRTLRAVASHEPALAGLTGFLLVALPVVLMPDATRVTWTALRPVEYPPSLVAAVHRVEADPTGSVVTVPFAAYRLFRWGNPVSVADPAAKWVPGTVDVSDALTYDTGVLRGEDPWLAAVGRAVRHRSAAALRGLGVRWVLTYRDQPGQASSRAPLGRVVLRSGVVELARLDGAVRRQPTTPGGLVVLVGVVDGVLGAAGALAALVLGAGRLGRARPRLRR